MHMEQRHIDNWRELTKTGYFDLLPDGRLKLAVDGLDGLVDFHTHLGWTFLLARPIDLTASSEMVHNFGGDLKVNIDIYSGQNFHEQRPKWSTEDYLSCILPLRGKHVSHTMPNIVREMDALKIGQSVCLCIDMWGSNNSERAAKVLSGQSRLVFFCSVTPKDRRAREKMERYVAAGARGMKVHPEIQLAPIDSDLMLNHLRLWRRVSGGKPVLFHSGFNGFEPKKAREHAAIEKYEPAAGALEDTPCIFGHAAMNSFRTAVEIALKFPNVSLEISGQPPAHIREMLDKLGEDRLLFGSDWPVYPQAIPMAKVLLATEDAPAARMKILRDNALKLLKSK